MNIRLFLASGLAVSLAVSVAPSAEAADSYFLPSGGGSVNTPANWSTGSVPGPSDTAIFTNFTSSYVGLFWSADLTNANVKFLNNTLDYTPYIYVGSYRWIVTNQFLIDFSVNKFGCPVFNTGNLFVTNDAGTAQMLIAPTGYGTMYFAGNLAATLDTLVSTNTTTYGTGLWLDYGTLTTLHGSTINRGGWDLQIGFSPGAVSVWNMLGGTNTVLGAGVSIAQAGNVTSTVHVVGLGTVWTNAGTFSVGNNGFGTFIISNGAQVISSSSLLGGNPGARGVAVITGSNSTWTVAGNSRYFYVGGNPSGAPASNQLTIADGGRLNTTGSGDALIIGAGTLSRDNQVLITGANSLWDAGANTVHLGYAPGNQLTLAAGGQLLAGGLNLGVGTGGSNTVVTVDGNNSLATINGTVGVGSYASNTLRVSNGGRLSSTTAYIGNGSASTNNLAEVTGSGSVWTNSGSLWIGNQGWNNKLVVSDGGAVYNNGGRVGGNVFTTGNVAIVTGPGSVWKNNGDLEVGWQLAEQNQLIVTNGGRVESASGFVGRFTAHNNSATVTGPGSVWSNSASLYVGLESDRNTLTIANGGRVDSQTSSIGQYSSANSNTVNVTGAGSLWVIGSTFQVGGNGGTGGRYNQLNVTAGGKVDNTAPAYIAVGNAAGGSNNAVTVSGAGSLWDAGANIIRIGAAGTYNSLTVTLGGTAKADVFYVGNPNGTNNTVLVTDGGTLDTIQLTSLGGVGSTATVREGILQFYGTPSVNPNPAGGFVITNGTVSFRNVTSAQVTPVSGLTYQGVNGYRLNNATNASGTTSYTFSSGLGASNYARLTLTNHSRWRSGSLTIASDGGIIGGAGDTVSLTANFTVNQNNASVFDLSASTVEFTGGGSHTNLVTGDDFGHNGLIGNDGFGANFAYGTLRLGSISDLLYVGGDGSSSNALYALHLELPGNDTNLVANLRTLTPNINIYYGASVISPGNAYLNDQVYNLTGGGLLLPAIPEPSALLLVLVSLALLRRRWHR